MKQHQETHTDDGYLNDFHREWNERCMKTNEKIRSMRYTHEYLKAQSQRMDALVKAEEERLRAERKKRSKGGQ